MMNKRRSVSVMPKSNATAISVNMTVRAAEDFGGLGIGGGGTPQHLSPSGSPSSTALFSFKKGDIICISKLDSEGYGYGTLEDGRKGWFPMELIEEEKQPASRKKNSSVYFQRVPVDDEGLGTTDEEGGDNAEDSEESEESESEESESEESEDESSHENASDAWPTTPTNSPVDTALSDSAGQKNVLSIRGKISSFLSIRPSREDLQKKHILHDDLASPVSNKEAKMKLEGLFKGRSNIEENVVKGKHLAEFGVPLSELTSRYSAMRGIPFIVFLCVNHLLETGLEAEGLFRISVELSEIMVLKVSLEQGMTSLSHVTNPHAVAALLKQFFRELPDPLLTFGLFDQWMEAAGIDDSTKRKAMITSLLEKLPKPARATLGYLIIFLRLLAYHSDINKMSCLNLGVIFAPTILRKKVESVDDFMKFARAQYLVETLLDEYETFFPEYQEQIANLPPLPGMEGEEPIKSKLMRVLLATDEEKERIRKLPMDRLAFISRGSVGLSEDNPAERKRALTVPSGKKQELPPVSPPSSTAGVIATSSPLKASTKKKNSLGSIGTTPTTKKLNSMEDLRQSAPPAAAAEEKSKKKKKKAQGEEKDKKKKNKERVPGKIRKTASDADFVKKKKRSSSPPPRIRPGDEASAIGRKINKVPRPKIGGSGILPRTESDGEYRLGQDEEESICGSFIEAERRRLDEERKSVAKDTKKLQEEKCQVKGEFEKLADEKKTWEEQRKKLESLEEEIKQLKEAKEKFEHEKSVFTQQQNNQDSQKQLEEFKKKNADLTAQSNKLSKENQDLRKQVRTMYKEKEELERANKSYQKEKEKLTFDLKQVTQQKEELEAGHVILQKVKERADKLLQVQKEEAEKNTKALVARTKSLELELREARGLSKSGDGMSRSDDCLSPPQPQPPQHQPQQPPQPSFDWEAETAKRLKALASEKENEKHKLEEEKAKVLEELKENKSELERLQQENQKVKEKLAESEAMAQREKEKERKINEELEKERDALKEERRAREELEKEKQDLARQIAAEREEKAKTVVEVSQPQQPVDDQLKEEKERLEKELQSEREERERIDTALKRQKEETKALAEKLKKTTGQLNEVQEQLLAANEEQKEEEEEEETPIIVIKRSRRGGKKKRRKEEAGSGGAQLLSILDNNTKQPQQPRKQQHNTTQQAQQQAQSPLPVKKKRAGTADSHSNLLEAEKQKERELQERKKKKEMSEALDRHNKEMEKANRDHLKALGMAIDKLVQQQAEEMRRVQKEHLDQLKSLMMTTTQN